MFQSRRIVGALVAVVILSQSACVDLESPLSDPDKSTPDERLLGVWKLSKEQKTIFAFFGRPRANDLKNAPKGLVLWHNACFSDQNELEWSPAPMYCFMTRVGNDHYLNVVNLRDSSRSLADWKKKDVKSYWLMKLTFAKKTLTMQYMDNNRAAKAISSRDLKGTVKQDGTIMSPHVRITESASGLVKYLEDGRNASLFSDEIKITFSRVK